MKHFTLAALLLCCACHGQQSIPIQNATTTVTNRPPPQVRDSIICPGDDMLENETDTIPPNLFSPQNRDDICGWWMPDDTITPNGNFIKYLISNDTCCRDNLYLKWGNSKFENIESLSPLRQFHPKMNPEYLDESSKYLFLGSAASGGMPVIGFSLWLLPLTPNQHLEVYTTVAFEAYDLASLTIIQEVHNDSENYPQVEAYNIRTHRTKPIKLQHRISAACAAWAIDSVSITPSTIFLRMEVLDDRDEIISETIVLPNDIK